PRTRLRRARPTAPTRAVEPIRQRRASSRFPGEGCTRRGAKGFVPPELLSDLVRADVPIGIRHVVDAGRALLEREDGCPGGRFDMQRHLRGDVVAAGAWPVELPVAEHAAMNARRLEHRSLERDDAFDGDAERTWGVHVE